MTKQRERERELPPRRIWVAGKTCTEEQHGVLTRDKSAHTALAVKACLLGCNSATLNAQVTFVYSSRYISFSWGGPLKIFAPKPFLCCCFRNFSDDFWALDLKRVLRWNFGSFWGGSGNRKTDLGGFRQRKNGQQWKKKTANTDVFKGFGMLEYWTHCKNQCFGPTLYWRTRKLCCFWRKDWNNTVRTCVLDRLYAQECINYVGVEGKQSKNTAKKNWGMFNIFTRTEPKNLRCGRPPTRSGVNRLTMIDIHMIVLWIMMI